MTEQTPPTPESRLREAVMDAMLRIVVNELRGVSDWQVGLARRLTFAALATLDAARQPAPETGLREAAQKWRDAWDETEAASRVALSCGHPSSEITVPCREMERLAAASERYHDAARALRAAIDAPTPDEQGGAR